MRRNCTHHRPQRVPRLLCWSCHRRMAGGGLARAGLPPGLGWRLLDKSDQTRAVLTLTVLLAVWSGLAQAQTLEGPRLETFTRYEASLQLGSDPELGCASSASPSASDPADPAVSPCIQQRVLELLRASQSIESVPGLRLEASLRYGLLMGDAPLPRALSSYGPLGDLKVLGLTASWHSPRKVWSAVLGRQSRWDADPLLFDGLALTFRQRTPRAAQSVTATLYLGLWSLLDADVRAEALYGALFSQQPVFAQQPNGAGSLGPAGLNSALLNEAGLLGVALRWRPLWPLEVDASDSVYQSLHHTRLGLRYSPLPILTFYGEARSLSFSPRDVRLGLDALRASGGGLALRVRHSFEGLFPLSALAPESPFSGVARLLIGNLTPYTTLHLDAWRPLGRRSLLGLELGLSRVEPSEEQAFQRSLLELGLHGHWEPIPGLTGRLELQEVLAPQAGQFTDAGELVLDDGEGDPLDLNAFPNLTGEGEEALLSVTAQAQARLHPQLRLTLGGSALWLQKAYTALLILQDGAGGRVWLASQWLPGPHLYAEGRYQLEQALSSALSGQPSTTHTLSLSLRARW